MVPTNFPARVTVLLLTGIKKIDWTHLLAILTLSGWRVGSCGQIWAAADLSLTKFVPLFNQT